MMCEVVKSTFEYHFPIIEASIRKADFIAIDTEFTGLDIDEKCQGSLFDTSEERYAKLRKNVSQFTLSQIGLAIFTKVPDENVYQVETFNMPLLAMAFGSLDVCFSLQTSSLNFLCTHNFDFNKFIYEGVPFMNEEQETQTKKQISGGTLFNGVQRKVDEEEVQNVCSCVAEWIANSKAEQKFIFKKTEGMKQIRDYVLHIELRNRFPSIWTATDPDGDLLIEKVTNERRQELEIENIEMKKQYEKELLETLLGFTRVFRVLQECKKPLVGHNLLTDLLFLYQKFHKPLPAKYIDFKQELHQMFPSIFDTKHICLTLRKEREDMKEMLVSTGLGGLYLLLKSEAGIRYVLHSPIINEAAGYGRYTGKHVPHEAGYDAFMCGYVFVRLSHIVQFHGTRSSDILPCTFRQYQRKMARFNNRINVIRGTLFNIRLDGPDPVSERPPMLFVKRRGYTQKLDCDQLAHWFSPYGSVDIRLMDSSRALVATGNFRCAKDIMSAFKKHEVLYVAKYSALRHSPVVRRLLWAGAVFSGSLCVWVVMSSRKQN